MRRPTHPRGMPPRRRPQQPVRRTRRKGPACASPRRQPGKRSKIARSEAKPSGVATTWRVLRRRGKRSKIARSEAKPSGVATTWRVLRRRGKRSKIARSEAKPSGVNGLDGGIVASTALLAALGIVMIYSTTAPLAMGRSVPPHLVRHLLALAGGLLCVALCLGLPLGFWRRLALPLWGGCVALLVATLLVGVDVNGARRWIDVPGLPLRLQPAELTKWATLLAVASALARRGASPAGARTALVLVSLPAALLLAQPDFGSAALLLVLGGALLFAAGTPLRPLGLLGAGALGGAALYVALRPYALARWLGFLDPWRRANDEGFQLVQSFIAFARGGTLGVGLGDGRQKLFYLPEAHTDFMLSVVAEELGLVGVLVVLGAFSALVVAGTRIALRAREPFVLLVAFGMTALLAVPALVNAAVVMGLLPTTGFPLPFVSYGGNALLVCALAVGLLLRIAAREAHPRAPRIAAASPRGVVRW